MTRLLAAVCALLLTASGIGYSTPPPAAALTPFSDVSSSPFNGDIDWAFNTGITTGCTPTAYCPEGLVTREQMASFLVRMFGLPVTSSDFFADDEASMHEADINRLAASGITSGCSATRFCPGDAVTREQMASLLSRALGLTLGSGNNYFYDDNGRSHEADIDRIAAAGIGRGCAQWRFCPTGTVTRGQMAAFLHRVIAPVGAPLDPAPPPPPPPPPPAPPAPGQNVVTFTPSVTQAQLLAAIADNAVDVIALAPGTYPLGGMSVNADRSRPVLIHPQVPGTVVINGLGADKAFTLGYPGRAANIAFDDLIFENYFIGERGVFTLSNAHNITMNHITIRNTRGQRPTYSWALYLSSSGGSGPSNVVAEYWNVVGDPNRTFGGIQLGHDPNARTAVMRHWTITNVTFPIYAAADATNITFDDFNIYDSGASHDGGNYAVVVVIPGPGLVRDICLTRSGGFYIYSPQVVDQRACQTP
jgi:hypothetical protein